jgi:23S rRNA G2445 N2-methylase RlmL
MTETPELTRVPSKQYQRARPEYRDIYSKYDYVTPDGRWYVEQNHDCGRGWSVIDTSGECVCTSCWRNVDGHATIKRTLAAAKAFISEWSA